MGEAFWREVRNGKCDFNFQLVYKKDNLDISQDLHAVRTLNDRVESLLQHVENKIKFYIKEECEKLSLDYEENYANIDMNIKLNSEEGSVDQNSTCKKVLKSYQKLLFSVLDQHFNVTLNAPLIYNFTLPNVIFCDTVVRPLRFTHVFVDQKRSEFMWYRSKDKKVWHLVDHGWEHKVSKRDLGFYLKVVCKPANLFSTGADIEAISKFPVYTFPEIPKCPFEDRQQHTASFLSGKSLRVMTYNVLSDRYCNRDDAFDYCSPQYLTIGYRKRLVIKELLGYKADIMCLQEVDESIFRKLYSKKLREVGYRYMFNRKGNSSSEGLALMHRSSRFDSIYQSHVVLSELVLRAPMMLNLRKSLKPSKVFEDLICQATSLQLVALKPKNKSDIILVANTHLYYHPECDHIRLLQLQTIFVFIEHEAALLKAKKENKDGKMTLIFCGDFNSNPERATFTLLTKGAVNSGEEIEKINKEGFTVSHPYKLTSAYGTPEFTNYTGGYKGCLDYIFFEQENLRKLQEVPIPDEDILSKDTALPSYCFPSDHVALVVDFKFRT